MKYMATAIAVSLAVAPAAAQHGPPNTAPPRMYTTAPVAPAEVSRWRQDVDSLLAALERLHPDFDQKTTRGQFESSAKALRDRIPSLAAHEIVVELQRIVTLVGDGHTNINLSNANGVDFHQLPVRVGFYSDGVWVEGADRAYASLVGGRVTAIGGVPIATVIERIEPLISRDNDAWFDAAVPHVINLIEVLHALRISDRLDRTSLTIVKDNRESTVEVRPLERTRPRAIGYPFLPRYTYDWVDASDPTSPPLFRRKFNEVYWYEYQPESRLLYIKWDQVVNRATAPTALGMIREATAFARDNESRIDKVLLDLRNNTGGEGGLLDPVVREFVRAREIDQPGRFFVAIGSRTFSAASILSVQLDRYSTAIFVGEPTGGKVNVAAGHVFYTLPNSQITVSISPLVYQSAFPQDTREFVQPLIYVKPAFADYAANRDPVVAEVIAYAGDTLATQLQRLLQSSDTTIAMGLLRRASADPRNRFNPPTTAANNAGYALLRDGNRDAALRMFRMNVNIHPAYANGWDSLAETYEAGGQTTEAIAAYEKVIALTQGKAALTAQESGIRDRALQALERLRSR